MINYRMQCGCHDCENVFQHYEYDENDSYYCTLNAPKRPLCGSVAMGEHFQTSNSYSDNKEEMKKIEDEMHEFYKAWENWREKREVVAWGICEAYVNNKFNICKMESIE